MKSSTTKSREQAVKMLAAARAAMRRGDLRAAPRRAVRKAANPSPRALEQRARALVTALRAEMLNVWSSPQMRALTAELKSLNRLRALALLNQLPSSPRKRKAPTSA